MVYTAFTMACLNLQILDKKKTSKLLNNFLRFAVGGMVFTANFTPVIIWAQFHRAAEAGIFCKQLFSLCSAICCA